jgi:hypothetical protein
MSALSGGCPMNLLGEGIVQTCETFAWWGHVYTRKLPGQ